MYATGMSCAINDVICVHLSVSTIYRINLVQSNSDDLSPNPIDIDSEMDVRTIQTFQ